MGNSASSARHAHDESVDGGALTPQGVYASAPRDYSEPAVAQAIVERRLAPFYRPLEDYEDGWDDAQILAARRPPPAPPEAAEGAEGAAAAADAQPPPPTASRHGHGHKRSQTSKDKAPERERPASADAALYRGAVECPICFLYYPPNINVSRCCAQPVCTECFVQIKRAEPSATHMSSEPATCPYCVQEHFGVVYTPPNWRAGLGAEGSALPPWPDSAKSTGSTRMPRGPPPTSSRRKSFGAGDPEVVTIDQIRPDWEAKLAAVRAQAARRANRRIIMRQVGDRLIPVGVTSGRVHALPESSTSATVSAGAASSATDDGGSGGSGSRRSRRRQQELQGLLGGMAGPDLEELMIMEAMRLSLLEHEEQQRKEKEAKEKAEKEAVKKGGAGAAGASGSGIAAGIAAAGGVAAGIATPGASASASSSSTPTASTLAASSPPVSPAPAASTPTHAASTPTSGTPIASPAAPGTPTVIPGTPAAAPGTPAAPSTPTPAHPELPPTDDAPALAPARPAPERADTMLSTFTDASADADERAGYGYLPGGSEESVLAREPLLADDA